MMHERLTSTDAIVLDLDEEGLDVAAIAIVARVSTARVRESLQLHADRRAAGSWSDAA